MRRSGEPLFLARETYRRRRVMDAARLLPFLGVFMFLVPLIWGDSIGTVSGLLYLFVGWVILILIAAVIATVLSRRPQPEDATNGEAGG